MTKIFMSSPSTTPQNPVARVLCGKSDRYYTHFGGWGEGEKAFIMKHLRRELPCDTCIICRGDHIEAKQHHSNTN